MPDDTIATAQIEIVASLDGLLADLDTARLAVSDSLTAIDQSISDTGNTFSSAFDPATSLMLAAASDAGEAAGSWRSLGDAAGALTNDVANLIVQLTILDPLLNSLSGSDAAIPTFGAGGLLGPLSDGLAPSFLGPDAGLGLSASATDSQPLVLPVEMGERVKLTPSNDRGGAGAVAVTNVSVVNNSGTQAHLQERTNTQGGKDVTVIIGEAMGRDVRINGPLGRAIRQTFGADRVPIQR
jgi:hypothetical protein